MNKRIFAPLALIIFALASLASGAFLMNAGMARSAAQATAQTYEEAAPASEEYNWVRVDNSAMTMRFDTTGFGNRQMTRDMPQGFVGLRVAMRVDFTAHEAGNVTSRSFVFDTGEPPVDANEWQNSPRRIVMIWQGESIFLDMLNPVFNAPVFSLLGNRPTNVFFQYPTYRIEIHGVYVSYILEDPNIPHFQVRFRRQDFGTIQTVLVPEYTAVRSDRIPNYPGTLPPLYRVNWQTQDGRLVRDAIIIGHTDFYAIMEPNFIYRPGESGIVRESFGSALERVDYNNETLERDFTNGIFRLPADPSIQALQDPIVINSFAIRNMYIPWEGGRRHFVLTLNTPRTNNVAISEWTYTNARQELVLQSSNTETVLMLGGRVLWSIPFRQFADRPPVSMNIGRTWTPSNMSFELRITDGQIRWRIEYGRDEQQRAEGNIGPAYRYNLVSGTHQVLGLAGVRIIRYNNRWSHDHRNTIFPFRTFNRIYTQYFSEFPDIDITGYQAMLQYQIDCFIDGELSFTSNLFANHWQRPELPAHLQREGYSVRWYLDPNFTAPLVPNFHNARMYTNGRIYGRWVIAEHEVTISWYTVQRLFVGDHGGRYFDAFVRESKTVVYQHGDIINLNDFGTNIGQFPFYNYIRLIPFIRWSVDITQPVLGDMYVYGIYRFPTATLRYFDVDENLFGIVEHEMTRYPIDILIRELATATGRNQYWYRELRQDEGILHGLFAWHRAIFRALFGQDAVLSGANQELLEQQQRDTMIIINAMRDRHGQRDGQLVLREYSLLVVHAQVRLEGLNQGAHGNAAFHVPPDRNRQWNALSGDPRFNEHITYWAEVHGMYSLAAGDFTMNIEFLRRMDGFDMFAMRTASFFGWFGNLFGRIFDALFGWINAQGIWQILLGILLVVIILASLGGIFVLVGLLWKFALFPAQAAAANLGTKTGGRSKSKNKRRNR